MLTPSTSRSSGSSAKANSSGWAYTVVVRITAKSAVTSVVKSLGELATVAFSMLIQAAAAIGLSGRTSLMRVTVPVMPYSERETPAAAFRTLANSGRERLATIGDGFDGGLLSGGGVWMTTHLEGAI